jgi:hypothetical protein
MLSWACPSPMPACAAPDVATVRAWLPRLIVRVPYVKDRSESVSPFCCTVCRLGPDDFRRPTYSARPLAGILLYGARTFLQPPS